MLQPRCYYCQINNKTQVTIFTFGSYHPNMNFALSSCAKHILKPQWPLHEVSWSFYHWLSIWRKQNFLCPCVFCHSSGLPLRLLSRHINHCSWSQKSVTLVSTGKYPEIMEKPLKMMCTKITLLISAVLNASCTTKNKMYFL